MTTQVTIGKRGTLVIPKPIRSECGIDEGTQVDISTENNVIVIMPSLQARSRIDENFDKAKSILENKGVTLEMALAKLKEIKQSNE